MAEFSAGHPQPEGGLLHDILNNKSSLREVKVAIADAIALGCAPTTEDELRSFLTRRMVNDMMIALYRAPYGSGLGLSFSARS